MNRYKNLRFPGFKYKAVTLSYDDGPVYDERLMEILDKNGIKCTFNLNSGCFSQDGTGLIMTKEKALALYADSPHEIAVHGKNHYDLSSLPPAVIADEILNGRIALETMFGRRITGLAYPYGTHNPTVETVAKQCGIEYAKSGESGNFELPRDWMHMEPTCHHKNPRLMELARTFVETNPSVKRACFPKLFCLWGHSYEFADNDNWNVIEEFAEYMGNRDDIWYATNGEIYNYIQAYNSLQYSADGRIIHNPTATDVCLYYYLNIAEDILVKAGETLKL